MSWMPDLMASWVRYAIVRVDKAEGIRPHEKGGVKKGEVEVVGLERFLERTVSRVEIGVVKGRVEEFKREMERRPGQGNLGKGMKKLAVMGEEEVRGLLEAFLG
ncbi:hypothetical protein QBC36DRAFT_122309 [Triangularia setosa]|uniref:Uncharacterized protein n=1 Tax=Triangularia setosa TaxID=2587417 RepID=A0AAN6WJD2_9PEZI|nr:hypothetical protein QBC36DRAFT_122309 [Podospora setosa]